MAHSRKTLLLSEKWDICLDGAGKIALARNVAATAQNVANETRLFTEDAYFIQDQGIPHFVLELGLRFGNTASLRAYLREAALKVPDVAEVLDVSIERPEPASRNLSGSISFACALGERESVALLL